MAWHGHEEPSKLTSREDQQGWSGMEEFGSGNLRSPQLRSAVGSLIELLQRK